MKSSISDLLTRQEKILYGNITSVVPVPLPTADTYVLVKSTIPFTQHARIHVRQYIW
jgi:hypothetical protein